MKKKEYLVPAVRVRFVVFDTALCEASMPTDDDKVIDDDDDFGGWAKEYDGFETGTVWDEE